jgi:hypothetical protein
MSQNYKQVAERVLRDGHSVLKVKFPLEADHGYIECSLEVFKLSGQEFWLCIVRDSVQSFGLFTSFPDLERAFDWDEPYKEKVMPNPGDWASDNNSALTLFGAALAKESYEHNAF